MGADSIETSLTTLLQGVSGYSSANCKRGDWKVLNAGVKKAIVVSAGKIEPQADGTSFQGDGDRYELIVNLLIKYQNDAQFDADLATETDAVMTKVRQYPKLNGSAGVVWSELGAISEPIEEFDPPQGPHWFLRQIMVNVLARSTTARLE